MNNYVVYMHISPSGKRYIGITKQGADRRWRRGNGYKTQSYFYRAIEKYGWENFQHIIVAKGLSEDEAKWLEIELIKEWNTTDKNKGYNITFGGESTNGLNPWNKGKTLSEEIKNKISKTRKEKGLAKGENNPMYGNGDKIKGENNPMYGKDWREGKSEEELKEIKEKQIKNTPKGESHFMYGKSSWDIMDEEKRKKRLNDLTIRMTGENHFNAKSVICITTEEIFKCIREAEGYYKCHHISECCRGKRNYAGRLENGTKLVWMYYEDYLKMKEGEI